MIKNKNGFIFSIPIIITFLVISAIVLGLLIWFGLRISNGLIAVVGFLKTYGIYIFIISLALVFYQQLRAVANMILSKFGIKV